MRDLERRLEFVPFIGVAVPYFSNYEDSLGFPDVPRLIRMSLYHAAVTLFPIVYALNYFFGE